jgi:hypothetical protein
MVDLSTLTDEQLTDLYKQKTQPSASPDLSKLSDEELGKLYQTKIAEGKTAPPEEPKDTGYYWRTQQRIARQGAEQMSSGISDIMHPGQGVRGSEPYYIGKGLAQLAGGAFQYTASPFLTYPSLIGQHTEHLTGGAIPRAYPEFAANLAFPEIGMGRYPAMIEEMLAASRAKPPPGFVGTLGSRAAQAAKEENLAIPRAVTSTSAPMRIGAQAVAPIPYLGTPVREAVQAVPEKISSRVEELAGQYGVEQPKNIVGGGIEETLGKAGKAEAAQAQAAKEARDVAAKEEIDRQNAAAQAAWERTHQEREGEIRGRQAESERNAEATFGLGDHPNVTAEQINNDVQQAHATGKKAEQAAWKEVENVNANVDQKFADNLHGDMEQGLTNREVTLTPEKTPNALNMMAALKKLTGEPGAPATGLNPRMLAGLAKEYGGEENIPSEVIQQFGGTPGTPAKPPDFGLMGEHAPAPGDTHVTAQGMNELRKRVTAMANKADRANREDVRASNAVKSLFEDKLADAFENHTLPGGDPNAHAVIRNAVDETRAFKQRFGYNYGSFPPGVNRQAASELNQIATGNAGATDIASKLVGGSPGRNEVSQPLYRRILGATDNPGAVRDRLRATYWREVNHPTPNTAARKIEDLGTSPMGKELFSPQELEQQRAHGVTKQQTELELKRAAEQAKIEKPKPVKFKPEPAPEPGKAETLANKVLGRNRSEQQIFDQVDQFAKTDPKNFARTWGRMTEDNRKEFTAAWIRSLGGDGEFNPAQFAKNWESYSDQAKTIMLRDRGDRRSMDNLAEILKEYGNNIKKYGNPSGTAQISFYQKLLTGAIKYGSVPLAAGLGPFHPISALIAGVGARQFAKYMAKPESAVQIVRWSKLAKAYQNRPDPAVFRSLSRMTRSINEQAQERQ